MSMNNVEQILRVVFSGVASLISAALGYGYHWIQYHNIVYHSGGDLPQTTRWVTAIAPWVFLVPLAVLCTGMIWRRHRLVVLLTVHLGWLFAIAWPPLCLYAWTVPEMFL
jgi:hypothetical protein